VGKQCFRAANKGNQILGLIKITFISRKKNIILNLYKSYTTMITRGHSLKLQKRECRTVQRANEFGMRVINIWNSLPEEVIQSSSVNVFKGQFDRFYDRAELQISTDAEMGHKSVGKSVILTT
jgi:hypothetical protein